MKMVVIGKNNSGQRLNKFLGRYLDAAPQSFIYKMLRKKNIKYNGRKVEGSEIISEGDVIEIYLADDTIAKFRKNPDKDNVDRNLTVDNVDHNKNLTVDNVDYNKNLGTDNILNVNISVSNDENAGKDPLNNIEIIYEDEDILILNKPAGMLSQKARPEDYSLNERIVEYYHNRESIDPLFTPSVCNRLDRNTSGIILAGMSYQGTRILSKMLKDRTLQKYYLTAVKGRIEKASTIKGFLTKKEAHNQVVIYADKEEAVRAGIDNPAYIETRYEPIRHGSIDDGRRTYDITLLKVELITGKTHQIRAHLKSIGHPILGDGKYGHKDINAYMRKELGLKHQLLHAYEIHFPDNVDQLAEILSGKVFQAKLNNVFESICDDLF
ncbi:MAG: RluA family pseudouridine synthase [Lachnospiraceae bacterium]|nr:RluA family pseudouridine synthase [Lachnospiraceae bacterium]